MENTIGKGMEDADLMKVFLKLQEWQKEERIYRDYYRARQQGLRDEEIPGMEDAAEEDRVYLTHPERIDPRKTEKDFFSVSRNVQLLKHPRFFPLFFHEHTFFEMIYVMRGSCMEYTGKSRETARRVLLEEGDLFLLSPGISHGIECTDEDGVVINILIRHSTFMDIFLNTIRDKSQLALFFVGSLSGKDRIPYLLFHTGQDSQIRKLVLEMAGEQEEEDEYSDRITCAILTVFFQKLNRRHSPDSGSGREGRQVTEYGQKILECIVRNYRTITLRQLSKELHFSIPYCSRIVQEMTGSSFQDLITGIRLQQGENLLSHTQLSVAEIGDQIGYKNPETFIRAFQRVYHMSPGQYRKNL